MIKIQWITLPFQVRYGNTSSKSHADKEEVSSSSVTKDIKKSSSQGEVKTEGSFTDKKESGLSIKTDNELEAAMKGTFSLGKRIGNSPMEEETIETVFLLALSTISMVFSLILNNAPDGSGPFTYLYLFFIICIFTILNYLYVGIFNFLAKMLSDTRKNERETPGKK